MTEEQYKNWHRTPVDTNINLSILDLEDKSDRTLIFGYTIDRDTFHVYLEDAEFVKVIYDFKGKVLFYHVYNEEEDDLPPRDFVPCKRVYPEACDFEFCKLLASYDVWPPFTTYGSLVREPNVKFYGKRVEELER